MDVGTLNARLSDALGVGEVLKVIAELANDDQAAADLLAALQAVPLSLDFMRLRPLFEQLETPTRLWWIVDTNPQDGLGRLARLDTIVDELTNRHIVAHICEILWWDYSHIGREPYERYANRSLATRLDIAGSGETPTARLQACWAGSELALKLSKSALVDQFRIHALDAGFQFAVDEYPWDVASLRMAGGLKYLYGILCRWQPQTPWREATTIVELCARHILPLPLPLVPGYDWISRLRYLIAPTDSERVRVVEEVCRSKLAALSRSPMFGGGELEVGDLSLAVEDVAYLAETLSGNKEAARQLNRVTETLVLEIQRIGNRPPARRKSLVAAGHLGQDARAAQRVWRRDVNSWPSANYRWLRHLGCAPSPLEHPDGLEQAAADHRAKVGGSRAQIVAMGFNVRDVVAGADLDQLAYAEVARQRIEAWGLVIADRLRSIPRRAIRRAWFAGTIITDDIASRFAHALRLFVSGDTDAAAHLLVPRIESAIRQAAIALDVPALQIAYSHLGNVEYLGPLIRRIEDTSQSDVSAHWHYLRLLLLEPRAAALRNMLSHGVRSDIGIDERVSRQEAALLIHAALFLASLDSDGTLRMI